MNETAFTNYLVERYEAQMEYYKKAAAKNQKRYKLFQWILIVLSALTPVLAALSKVSIDAKAHNFLGADLSITVVVVSSIVAILTTGLKTFNYQELWITYRSTYEKLKPEIHYYHFNVGEYGIPAVDKESLFVARVEAVLDAEHIQWPSSKKIKEEQQEADTSNAL